MKNLLECDSPDRQIIRELEEAKIEVVRVTGIARNMVTSFFIGKLGAVIFERSSWDFWSTKVSIPLDVVKEMYQDPALKKGLSIGGWSPGEEIHNVSISYIDREGKTLIAQKEMPTDPNSDAYKVIINQPKVRIVEDPAAEGKPFVRQFFIYSEVALRLFADALKKHKLV